MKDPQKSVKSTSAVDKSTGRLSDEKLAAMKERARKWKPANTAGGEADVLAKIAGMAEPDRGMAERIHAIVKVSAPALSPRTWYGSPAYARDGNVICYFWPRAKFKARYATLGFSDKAHVDDGTMWPNSYALTELTASDEERISALVKKAAG
jgi:uncharacterized protein YdhG (YjbR/CyaY superfamily)